MNYIRHTIVPVDPGKNDEMLSHLTGQLDTFKSTQGLVGIRVVDAVEAENRIIVTAVYENKAAADAAATKAMAIRDGAAAFVTGPPLVREGEIAWQYVAEGKENSVLPGYARYIAAGYNPSKFDAMVAYAESQIEVYKSIEGLRRIFVVPVSGSEGHPLFQQSIPSPDNRMFVTAVYDNRETAVAAREKVNTFWAGMTEFLTDELRIMEGDFVYGFSFRH
jgi:quinol monooxygenase YgiN